MPSTPPGPPHEPPPHHPPDRPGRPVPRRRLDVIAASGHATVHQSVDPTGWLIDQAVRFAAALTDTVRVCPHLTPAPGVVHAAVWAPGVVVCPACTHLLTPTATEDSTCDRCRATVTEIYPGTVAFGPILLAYGLCAPCQTAAGLAPPAPRVEGGIHARTHRPRTPRTGRRTPRR